MEYGSRECGCEHGPIDPFVNPHNLLETLCGICGGVVHVEDVRASESEDPPPCSRTGRALAKFNAALHVFTATWPTVSR